MAAAETGQQLQKDNKLVDARKQFFVCARADCPPAVSQDCVKWLSQTESSIGSLKVTVKDQSDDHVLDGVRLLVDGTERVGPEIELDPGKHVVRAERNGYTPAESATEITPGEHDSLVLQLQLVPTPTPTVVPQKKYTYAVPAASWILGGVGVLGVAGFAVFGALGLSDQDSLRTSCAPFCTSSDVAPANTKFIVADTALVVGAVALTAAIVIAIAWPSRTLSQGTWRGPLLVY